MYIMDVINMDSPAFSQPKIRTENVWANSWEMYVNLHDSK